MSEEFTIQCPQCGTYYNDLQEACPYCGEPQPRPQAGSFLLPEAIQVEQPPEAVPPETAPADPFQQAMPGPDEFAPETDPLPDDYLQDPDEVYLPPEDAPFADDDIFAVAGQEDLLPDHPDYDGALLDEAPFYHSEQFHPDDFAAEESRALYPGEDGFDEEYLATPPQFDLDDELYPDEALHDDELLEEAYFEEAEAPSPPLRRLTWRRFTTGCLAVFLCTILFYGAVGVLAVRSGLQERALLAQTESQERYQKGQELLAGESFELAIAEFERALKLDPGFTQAREALRQAQRISQAQPTPTSQTRTAAATDIFARAQTLFDQGNWSETIQALSQVRDLDSDHQPEQVSDMLFNANFELGLQLTNPDQLEEAVTVFEQALAERPNDPDATTERAKAILYLEGIAEFETGEIQSAVRRLSQLYREDDTYLDTPDRLSQAYEAFGDELADVEEWCLAEEQYNEALAIESGRALQVKVQNSQANCEDASVTQIRRATPEAAVTPAPNATARSADDAPEAETDTETEPEAETETEEQSAAAPAGNTGGSILYSAYNRAEQRWEILSMPANGGGQPRLLVAGGTMPALSPNSQILLYHSERSNSVGLHALDLVTGTDTRATIFSQHILPRWSGDNLQFIFTAQEPGTGRWLVYQGFADGKGEPEILADGRTPDWSDDGRTLAFQGTDREGNNPGIYLRPFGGGESNRLTRHESDRMPAFSPDGSRIAYMSTQSGNWDIFVVSTAGGEPQQITSASGNDGLPAWSPDGSQVAFVSDMGGSWAIYTTNLSGSSLNRVGDWDGRNRPDWLMAQIWWGP